MEKLKFYDMKKKKSFDTDDYRVEMRGKSRMAIAKGELGNDCYRIIKKQ